MTKEEIRSKFLDIRSNLPQDKVDQLSNSISNNFLLHFNIIKDPLIHLFLPIMDKKEVNTFFLIDKLLKLKIKICTSVTNWETKEMEVYSLKEDTELVINKQGIPEPVNEMQIAPEVINICLIPLLAFDTNGHRVGFGKGFYDKFLKEKCSSKTIKVGLSLFEPIEDFIDNNQWDIKMDYVVTPDHVYKF